MANPVTYSFIAADTTYVCVAQTAGSGASLVLNGTGVDATSTYLLNNPRVWMTGLGFERPVSVTSSGTTSGVNFTITGKNIRGEDVSETIAGPDAGTVETNSFFYLIDNVSVSPALATAASVGIGSTGQSQWYKVDYQLTPVNIGMGVTVLDDSINWTVEQTTYDVEPSEPPDAAIIVCSDASMVSQTVSRQGNYVIPFGATRCVINSSATSGSLVFDIYQAGIV